MKWIMDFLLNECNFGGIEIVANLLVFGFHGTSVFQGIKSSVTIITCESWVPFSLVVHFVFYKVNLDVQTIFVFLLVY